MDDDSSDGMSDAGFTEADDRLWMEKESLAMERRSRTVGFREGIDVGKEQTLQEGFDHGYKHGAAKGFQSGLLQGLLRAFKHQFPHAAETEAIAALASELKAAEEATILQGEIPTATAAQATAVVAALAPVVPVDIPSSMTTYS
ncbi:hypothetical protein ACHHYP_08742 [Achlya hypogyna]|uniref:Essential protein Yae1 N-terminal domain-containing protein n=1 Tax=Achlya hypogyna TaxID=1202772 RepID=A0A1V9ZKJ9_ACHHY|nr:hypothetical protein ACHHYP_08742 [Achlya hypogyna]